MRTAPWIRNTLDIAGCPYTESHHPEAVTAQDLAHQEHVTGRHVAKTVAVKAGPRALLLVLPANRKVCLQSVKDLANNDEVRLMSEREMAFAFPDCELGAIPPLRHWEHVEVWMDETLRAEKEMMFPAGTHRDAITMPVSKWTEIVQPRVGAFSLPADAPAMDKCDEYEDDDPDCSCGGL